MLRQLVAGAIVFGMWCVCPTANGHFLVLVPDRDVVDSPQERDVTLDIRFTHPMERGPVMQMEEPSRFAVRIGDRTIDLKDRLEARQIDGHQAFTADVRLAMPGDHVFWIEPAPYWEPAEGKMIVHFTKVVVNFLGNESGWDKSVGLPVEIEPLVRPYGIWTGNTFRGIVRKHGKPVPFATIEVEYLNDAGDVTAPNDAFVTQVIKADAQGTFSYSIPKAGWWGFAALVDGDEPMTAPTGEKVPVEWGGLLWVKAVDIR
ncbi:DUF4198 domain-containing protein [Thermostilla marina]